MEPNAQFYNNAIFWIEVEKIQPNPFQPRHEFDQSKLNDLAESIKQYGILQPLVVTRKEELVESGIIVYYELISGERRLRASKIAGLSQVPAVIRSAEESDKVKLELAIIENLQREDLNPVDRAKAFEKLYKEFRLTHAEIGKRIGKSREYVSNTIRLLMLPEDMVLALSEGKISEGHTRPLLMLIDRPDEQKTLFKEIVLKKYSVREAERISRNIAFEKARKKSIMVDPELAEIEQELAETLGTRVTIDPKEHGGRLLIDFSNNTDLRVILALVKGEMRGSNFNQINPAKESADPEVSANESLLIDDRSKQEIETEDNQEIYSVKNFTV